MPKANQGMRVTVTLTSGQDRVLRAMATKHKVSVAWLMRFAVDRLLEQGASLQLALDLEQPRRQ